jgi:hypothetical protein
MMSSARWFSNTTSNFSPSEEDPQDPFCKKPWINKFFNWKSHFYPCVVWFSLLNITPCEVRCIAKNPDRCECRWPHAWRKRVTRCQKTLPCDVAEPSHLSLNQMAAAMQRCDRFSTFSWKSFLSRGGEGKDMSNKKAERGELQLIYAICREISSFLILMLVHSPLLLHPSSVLERNHSWGGANSADSRCD